MASRGNGSKVPDSGVRADAGMQAELQARGGAHEDRQADTRTVTTGGKTDPKETDKALKAPLGIDLDTGEPVTVTALGLNRIQATRHITPQEAAPPSAALIDAVSFTVRPPEGESMRWVLDAMRTFLPIDGVKDRKGRFGFKKSATFGEGAGLIAWGGESQRGRVLFSIQGKGCALVDDWSGLAAWLEQHTAKITRADVAFDDFTGESISIAWAIQQYEVGGFNAGGRKPTHGVHGDWLDGETASLGRTLGIGRRANGKYCRVYEKGKQLGEASSPWTRLEVEWRGKDRHIPYDILTRPGVYLAGAYPCLAGLNVEQERIRTVAHAATIAFDTAIANAKQQVGKTVNLMLHVYGGDLGAVVEQLQRSGIPARIEPYSYQLAGKPERLDPEASGSFAAIVRACRRR